MLAAWLLRQEPGRWETDAEQRGEKLGGQGIETGSLMEGQRTGVGGVRGERDKQPRVGNWAEQGETEETEYRGLHQP